MFHSSNARVKVILDGGYVLMYTKDSDDHVTSANISDVAALCGHVGATHKKPLLQDGLSTMRLEASPMVRFIKDGVRLAQVEGLALIKDGLFQATASKVFV